MPYIDQLARTLINLGDIAPETPGELNYAITKLLYHYLHRKEDTYRSYQTINDILGALEGAKLEFYRRVAAPYEDTKIAENGDVY